MSISKIANNIKSDKSDFPPVHLWEPELCVGQEITINREGDWLYNNSPIKNTKLVKLFSSVLRNDNGSYFLVCLLLNHDFHCVLIIRYILLHLN